MVGVSEVPFDGAGGDEQVLGDVAVGQAFGGELGDAALAGCQRVEPAEDQPPWPAAAGDQFGAGPLGQRQRPAVVSEVERGPEDLAAFCPVSGPAQGCPQVGQGAGVLQSRARAVERACRLGSSSMPRRRPSVRPAARSAIPRVRGPW